MKAEIIYDWTSLSTVYAQNIFGKRKLVVIARFFQRDRRILGLVFISITDIFFPFHDFLGNGDLENPKLASLVSGTFDSEPDSSVYR